MKKPSGEGDLRGRSTQNRPRCTRSTYRSHWSPRAPTLGADRRHYTFSSSHSGYKAHSLLALHHSAPESGMMGDNLAQPNRCSFDLQLREGCLSAQRVEDEQAAASPAHKPFPRYRARLENLASGQIAEETRNSLCTYASS